MYDFLEKIRKAYGYAYNLKVNYIVNMYNIIFKDKLPASSDLI